MKRKRKVIDVSRASRKRGVYTSLESGVLLPGEIQFTAASASRPKWTASATGDTVIMLNGLRPRKR